MFMVIIVVMEFIVMVIEMVIVVVETQEARSHPC